MIKEIQGISENFQLGKYKKAYALAVDFVSENDSTTPDIDQVYYILGHMLSYGVSGVELDPFEGPEYMQKAVELKNRSAMFEFASDNLMGNLNSISKESALEMMKEASVLGNRRSNVWLTKYFLEKDLDFSVAAEHAQAAYDSGNHDGYMIIIEALLRGSVVEKNVKAALEMADDVDPFLLVDYSKERLETIKSIFKHGLNMEGLPNVTANYAASLEFLDIDLLRYIEIIRDLNYGHKETTNNVLNLSIILRLIALIDSVENQLQRDTIFYLVSSWLWHNPEEYGEIYLTLCSLSESNNEKIISYFYNEVMENLKKQFVSTNIRLIAGYTILFCFFSLQNRALANEYIENIKSALLKAKKEIFMTSDDVLSSLKLQLNVDNKNEVLKIKDFYELEIISTPFEIFTNFSSELVDINLINEVNLKLNKRGLLTKENIKSLSSVKFNSENMYQNLLKTVYSLQPDGFLEKMWSAALKMYRTKGAESISNAINYPFNPFIKVQGNETAFSLIHQSLMSEEEIIFNVKYWLIGGADKDFLIQEIMRVNKNISKEMLDSVVA